MKKESFIQLLSLHVLENPNYPIIRKQWVKLTSQFCQKGRNDSFSVKKINKSLRIPPPY